MYSCTARAEDTEPAYTAWCTNLIIVGRSARAIPVMSHTKSSLKNRLPPSSSVHINSSASADRIYTHAHTNTRIYICVCVHIFYMYIYIICVFVIINKQIVRYYTQTAQTIGYCPLGLRRRLVGSENADHWCVTHDIPFLLAINHRKVACITWNKQSTGLLLGHTFQRAFRSASLSSFMKIIGPSTPLPPKQCTKKKHGKHNVMPRLWASGTGAVLSGLIHVIRRNSRPLEQGRCYADCKYCK